ncbi:MAG: hypothetical protein NC489_16325 [Ruminococcus flavefaciens]|nr:hypothetical protein [Ruminococcus flavefaciens]
MQQQIIDVISEINPDFLKYNDISDDNMAIFGQGKNRNIMIISYQCAALNCMLNVTCHAKYKKFTQSKKQYDFRI